MPAVGNCGMLNCMITVVISPGIHANRILPAQLVRIRRTQQVQVPPVVWITRERLPLN
jgi:hypothetical protein